MRVTQRDIARKLNLSQSLVTGVLNDRPNVWVSEENRQRILSAARELNYRPNAAARVLRQGRTNVVACVFFGGAIYQPIAETLADSLAERGYDLLLKVVPKRDQADTRLENLAYGGVCDAVVLWGLEEDTEQPAIQLASLGIPFVVKGRFEEEHPDWPQVDFDHETMMAQAVSHLAQLGHRRVAYVGFDNDLVYSACLLRGYHQACESLLQTSTPQELVGLVSTRQEDLWELLDVWFSMPEGQRPTAIVNGAGYSVWLAAEQWLAPRGLKLGEARGDLTMVGIAGSAMPLLFGEGMAYQEAELQDLARAMGADVLGRLLEGSTLERTVTRLLPPLRPLASLKLPLGGSAAHGAPRPHSAPKTRPSRR
ncbi:MAG TPA: LacI family DNA-binding transcriptional regulator [Armatimonadota bacterium]|jgi:DNA-binding LacI/PurR family transcriptional regulator